MGRMVKFLAVVIGVVVSSASPAQAVFIDFAWGPPHPGTASLSYAGGVAPLVGTDINVLSVVGIDTPLNSGVLGLRDVVATADFSTGPNIGGWVFAPGGFFTITGGVDLNDDGDITDLEDIAAGTTLLTGSFTDATTIFALPGTFRIIGAVFDDTKDEDLAGFYGLTSTGFGFGWDGGFGLSFLSAASSGSSFGILPGSIGSGDIINIPLVPEPSSLVLLGLGLLGGGVGWRRKWFSL